MDKSPVKAAAYGNLTLLGRVVRFKEWFSLAGSAHYELAKMGTIRLLPPEECVPLLQENYEHNYNGR